MKVKALLLSITMLMSLLGTSIFGTKGADVQAVQVAESTENSTTEEVREDASHAGESRRRTR